MTTQHSTISSRLRQNIQKLDLFTSLSDDEIDILVRHAKIHSLVEDERLFHEGEAGDFFAIVIEGRIEIKKQGSGEAPVTIATLTHGATLGEMALIDYETRSASAVAAEPSTLFILSRQSFDALIEQSPRCGVKLIRKIATILCTTLRRTSDLFADMVDDRLKSIQQPE